MRLLATTSAVLALAAVAPAPAPAVVRTPIPGAPVNGPVVAGGEAVWASARADEGFDLLAAQPGGGGYRTVQRFPTYQEPGGHDVYLVPRLSAAGARVGLAIDAEPITPSRYEPYPGPAGADVLSGPPTGPLESVFQCRPGLPAGVTAALTEHGAILFGPDCDAARATGLALRSDSGEMRPLTPSGVRVRAAGPFVGWLERDGDAVVYDTRTAAVAYRIGNPGTGRIADWDLQADGKVALAYASGADQLSTLAWYSPADPAPHAIGLPASFGWDLHIADDRIAYLRSHGWNGGSSFYFGDLGVTDLAGHARTISNRAIGVGDSHPALAFDGSNVTWTAPACLGATLNSQPIDAAPVIGPRPHCALRFRKQPRVLGKNAIRVPVRCTGFVLPSCGDSDVKLETVSGHVALGRDTTRYCDQTADVTLSRRGRALVRKFKTLRVRATVATIDTGGAREVRTAKFTLRTRRPITGTTACEDDY